MHTLLSPMYEVSTLNAALAVDDRVSVLAVLGVKRKGYGLQSRDIVADTSCQSVFSHDLQAADENGVMASATLQQEVFSKTLK